jgi:hypothetical protein
MLLTMLAIAIPAGAFTTGDTPNPFWYGSQFYGSSYNHETPVNEPGAPLPANPAWTYGQWNDVNFVVPR